MKHGGFVHFRPRGIGATIVAAVLAVMLSVAASPARGQSLPGPAVIDNSLGVPDVRGLLPAASDAQGVSSSLQILVLLTVLTLVPSILIMTTAFPRVLVVLAILRQAMGAPQLPPGQVLLGLSLFITFIVMGPTWNRLNQNVVQPYFDNQLTQREALDLASNEMRGFMYRQIEKAGSEEDVYMFLEHAEGREIDPAEPIAVEDVPMSVMIPAFMLAELKTAFLMGFRIYLPFLVIDMVISMILISMGMMMLPPVLISLPFKILLFVLADGWHLIVETLLTSFS